MWILLIAYVTRFLPYGLASATASMYQVGSELEESAREWCIGETLRCNYLAAMACLVAAVGFIFLPAR